MAPVQLKLVKEEPHLVTRRVTFGQRPTWTELALRVERLFGILVQNVAVSYFDRDGDQITATTDEELKDCIENAHSITPRGVVKLIVFDINVLRARATKRSSSLISQSPIVVNVAGPNDEERRPRSRSISPIFVPLGKDGFSARRSPIKVLDRPPRVVSRSRSARRPSYARLHSPNSLRQYPICGRSRSRSLSSSSERSVNIYVDRPRSRSRAGGVESEIMGPCPEYVCCSYRSARRRSGSPTHFPRPMNMRAKATRTRSRSSSRVSSVASGPRSNARSGSRSSFTAPIIVPRSPVYSIPDRSCSRSRRSRARVIANLPGFVSYGDEREVYFPTDCEYIPKPRYRVRVESRPNSRGPALPSDIYVPESQSQRHAIINPLWSPTGPATIITPTRRNTPLPMLAPPAAGSTNDDVMRELKELKEYIAFEMNDIKLMQRRSRVNMEPGSRYMRYPEAAPAEYTRDDIAKDLKEFLVYEMNDKITRAVSSVRAEITGTIRACQDNIKESLASMSDAIHSEIKGEMETKDLVEYLNAARVEVAREVREIREEREHRRSREGSMSREQVNKTNVREAKEEVKRVPSLPARQTSVSHSPFRDERDHYSAPALPGSTLLSHSDALHAPGYDMVPPFPSVPSVNEPPVNYRALRPHPPRASRRHLSPYFRHHGPCRPHHRHSPPPMGPPLPPCRPLPSPPNSFPRPPPSHHPCHPYRSITPPPLLASPPPTTYPFFSTSGAIDSSQLNGHLNGENANRSTINNFNSRSVDQSGPFVQRVEGRSLNNTERGMMPLRSQDRVWTPPPVVLPPAPTFYVSYNADNNVDTWNNSRGDWSRHPSGFMPRRYENDAPTTQVQAGRVQPFVPTRVLTPEMLSRSSYDINNSRAVVNSSNNDKSNSDNLSSSLSQQFQDCRAALDNAKRAYQEKKAEFRKVRKDLRKEREKLKGKGKGKGRGTIVVEDVLNGPSRSGCAPSCFPAELDLFD